MVSAFKDVEKQYYENLLNKAKFSDQIYKDCLTNRTCKPLMFFFKNLLMTQRRMDEIRDIPEFVTRFEIIIYLLSFIRSRMKILIPDTFVFGIEEQPIYFYTSQKNGTLVR